jgi:rod shape-determining protein MreD
MSSATGRHIWTYRAIFLSSVLILGRLLPLGLGESGLPGPDLLLAVTFAWLLRQPAVVPLASIVLVFLMADFLLAAPAGALDGACCARIRGLRRRRLQMTEFPFLVEWGAIAGAVATMILAERVFLWILFLPIFRRWASASHKPS